MTDYDKIRLAIYEKADITEDERQELLILAEERKNDSNDDSNEYIEKSNRVFQNAYVKASVDYKNDIKIIKSLIKKGEYNKASEKIKKAKKDLMDLDRIVDNTPVTMSTTIMSHCFMVLKNSLISYSTKKIAQAIIGNKKHKAQGIANVTIDRMSIPNEFKDLAKKEIRSTLNDKPKLLEDIYDQLMWDAVKTGYKTIIRKEKIEDRNEFKMMAKKEIRKELTVLARLDAKLRRLR